MFISKSPSPEDNQIWETRISVLGLVLEVEVFDTFIVVIYYSLRPTSLCITKSLTVILTIVSDSRGHSSGLQSREAREIVSYEDI